MPDTPSVEELEQRLTLERQKHQDERRSIMQSLSAANQKVAQQSEYIDYQGRELTRIGPSEQVAARARAERDRALEKAKRAESARIDAERAAEKERFARLRAEEERDRLLAALREASKQESRIDRVLAEQTAD